MSSRKEKILQNINRKYLEFTPKLSLGKDSYVDLDYDKDTLEAGAKKLMLRFFKKQELFFKSISTEENIELSDIKYRDSYNICRSISERLSLPFLADNGFKLEKPGKKFQDIKKKLEDEMSAKREEEYRKRIKEYNLWKNESKKDLDETKNLKNDEFLGSEILDVESSKEEKETSNIGDCSKNGCSENCSSPINSQEQEQCSTMDEADNSDECSLITPYQPGGGLMHGGSELTQQDEELPKNLLSPSLKFQINEKQCFKDNSDFLPLYMPDKKENFCVTRQKLFTNSLNSNDVYDLNDALEFCSGKFPISELDNVDSSDAFKYHENTNFCMNLNHDKVVENIKSNGDSEAQKKIKTLKRVLQLEDSEEEDNIFELENDNYEESKTSTISFIGNEAGCSLNCLEDTSDDENIVSKSKGAKYLLHLSDEEDEEDEVSKNVKESYGEEENEENEKYGNGDDDDDDNDDDIDNESCNRSVHYDSEEQEIVNPKDFFEKEAELSGSELSDDEDEQGLDDFDAEDGDADELDYEQIKSQLGRIHLRHLLDNDSKNIRLLQELFFEDGDLYNDETYKKFKWRNLGREKNENTEECGVNLNIDNIASSDDEDVENIEIRKERLERQLLLGNRKEQEESILDDDLFKQIFRKIKVTSMKAALKNSDLSGKKEEIRKIDTKNSEIINISSVQTVRGSLLRRNEEFLSRLAKVISNVNENVIKSKNSKNFVFATKSPKKTKIDNSSVSKRKVQTPENFRPRKKLKPLSSAVKTSPSILDLIG